MSGTSIRAAAVLCAIALMSAGDRVPNRSHRGAPLLAHGIAPALVDPVTAAAPADFLSQARSLIAQREYWATASDAGLQAPNRRHDLRSYFEPTGVRVHARTQSESPPLLALRLAGIGRGGALVSAGAGVVRHAGNRVEIARPAFGLIEWFENSSKGLEQGFTIATPPAGAARSTSWEALVLELAVDGARADLRGDAIRLTSAAGRKLAYGKLVVVDADGAALAAHFEVPRTDRIRILVEDRDAAYPIVIDPLLEETDDGQLESNLAGSGFGSSVASAGDVNGDGFDDVIVGAPAFDSGQAAEGAAFVFHGGPGGIGDGNPSNADALIQSNQVSARLGSAVASAGDVNCDGFGDVVVGAPQFADPEAGEGAAFLFLGSAAGLVGNTPASAHARFEANQATAGFGASVASAGDVNGDGCGDLIVGAPSYTAGQNDEGAAFVFLGSAAGLANGNPTTAHATLQSNQVSANLGVSVASAGDLDADGFADVIVGADRYDDGGLDEGAAFVFRGGASGIASGNPATAHARFQGDQAAASFGFSVASAGDVNGDGYGDLIVGAYHYDAGELDEGAAFLFHGSAAGVSDGNPALAASSLESDQAAAGMGYSVASAGDVNGDGYGDVVVGIYSYDPGLVDMGSAMVALGRATGIASGNLAVGYKTVSATQPGAELGISVAAAGDVNGDGYDDVIAGAHREDEGQLDEGAAFVSHGGSTAFEAVHTAAGATRLEGDQLSALQGSSVAAAGDVNGDGLGDVIVGASDFDAGETNEGAAFLFLGAPDLTGSGALTVAAQLESNQADAGLGGSVASPGDVNGDGYADVVVGARFFDAGSNDEGAAFVFLGSAAGLVGRTPASAHAQLESNQASAYFGESVAAAGDLNGDGYGDLIIGSWQYDAGQTDEGAAFVFLGSAAGVAGRTPANAHARLEGDQTAAFFGASVASAGDVDGDGFGDLIVGAWSYDATPIDEGAAFVFLGAASGVANGNPATAHARLESNQSLSLFGDSVASAGDLNGDGYGDLVVGSPLYDAGQPDEGAAFVYLGSASGVAPGGPAAAQAQLESDQTGAKLGRSVASAGDVDGDGFGDLVIGAPDYDSGHGDEGIAFVFLGSGSGIASGNPGAAQFWLEADQASAGLGESVASAGDVNGDGFGDLVVGAPRFDAGLADEGVAFVFRGNGDGRSLRVQQRRGDGSGRRVEPGGGAFAGDRFAVELFARSPRGRERAKLEVEICPLGVSFGHATCSLRITPAWADLGTNGALLSQTVTGLVPSKTYAWRARTLFTAYRATQPGITAIERPAPWFRLQGRGSAGDIRTVPESGWLGLSVGALALAALRRRR